MRSRSVTPNGSSYTPGRATSPDTQYSFGPVDGGAPAEAVTLPMSSLALCDLVGALSVPDLPSAHEADDLRVGREAGEQDRVGLGPGL